MTRLSKTGLAYDFKSNEVEKVKNCNFNLFAHSLLHINTQVLTSHVGKIVELMFWV